MQFDVKQIAAQAREARLPFGRAAALESSAGAAVLYRQAAQLFERLVAAGVRADQESRRQEGVLVQPDTVVRKGNGSGYEQQFNEPLGAVVGLVILETRPEATGADWYRVRFPNGTQGWIPAEAGRIV